MGDTHSGLGNASPLTVLVAELRAHVGRAAAFMAGTTVFLPQQRKRYAGLCQLSVDVGIIQFCIDAFGFALVGEKKCFQLRVCDIIVQRPGDAFLSGCVQLLAPGENRHFEPGKFSQFWPEPGTNPAQWVRLKTPFRVHPKQPN